MTLKMHTCSQSIRCLILLELRQINELEIAVDVDVGINKKKMFFYAKEVFNNFKLYRSFPTQIRGMPSSFIQNYMLP